MGAVFIGLAGFAANTAEWVNVVAHVEKEIAVACVDPDGYGGFVVTDPVDGPIKTGRGDCNFGTVLPQEENLTKIVEVTASKSFIAQDRVSNVNFDVLWECKLADPSQLFNPNTIVILNGHETRNICRENLDEVNPNKLDDNIRDHVQVVPNDPGCLLQGPFDVPPVPEGGPAEIENLGRGQVGDEQEKCFYRLVLTVPACEGHLNPNTDPNGADALMVPPPPTDNTIPCNEDTSSDDPQEWDISADLGDDFKIQVVAFEYAQPQ
jgi:hypothetical protein